MFLSLKTKFNKILQRFLHHLVTQLFGYFVLLLFSLIWLNPHMHFDNVIESKSTWNIFDTVGDCLIIYSDLLAKNLDLIECSFIWYEIGVKIAVV